MTSVTSVDAARGPQAVQGPRHIHEIDSLRAFAMTAVIAEHCKILPFGWMGVWLFYVISGFVVTTSLLSWPPVGPKSMLGRFYTLRAARIAPIYLAYVLVGFVVSGLSIGRPEWSPLASLLLFYNNIQSAFGVGVFKGFPVGHLWTISVEMQFYLVFGFAFAWAPRRILTGLLISFLVLAPLLRFIGGEWLRRGGMPPLQAAFAIYSFSPMHFDSFAAGALLALGRAYWADRLRARILLGAGVLGLIAYAGAYAWINHGHGASGLGLFRNIVSGILIGDQRQVWAYSAVAALSAGVLATTLAGAAPWGPIVRDGRLQAVGRVSYGGYVYHAFCVQWIGRLLRAVMPAASGVKGKLEFGVVLFALALPATIGLALLSYRYVERPLIRWVNRRVAFVR